MGDQLVTKLSDVSLLYMFTMVIGFTKVKSFQVSTQTDPWKPRCNGRKETFHELLGQRSLRV